MSASGPGYPGSRTISTTSNGVSEGTGQDGAIAVRRRLLSLPPGARADLLRVLTSPSNVRADVIRQFYERGDDGMVGVLSDLEADELLRLQVIDALRGGVPSAE
jgi:hypothetical protein